ncbi:Protein CBG25341 [Caenorhabditis briggsae]|uniref:Protein CBG25341 n=1 Tax=Caenorhabditis briggsae TaxID=6238 RepID=B6IIK5_CAEBR|nr:Protein CBG25341 [Caenorhabditis briggsae]CAR99735.1 Protein CBG25341 [Caenorhabditis briggsae]
MISIVHDKGTDTSSGILNVISNSEILFNLNFQFFCVVLLLCSLWCQSKTLFTIISIFNIIDTFSEFYLLFTRILVALEITLFWLCSPLFELASAHFSPSF